MCTALLYILIKGDGGDVAFDGRGGGGFRLRLWIDFDDFLVPCLICGTFDEKMKKKKQIPTPFNPPVSVPPPPFLKICET